jgi:hypothetical protein
MFPRDENRAPNTPASNIRGKRQNTSAMAFQPAAAEYPGGSWEGLDRTRLTLRNRKFV